MHSISEISVESIREGKVREIFPEFYDLEDAIEDGGWHINDSVFNHTLTVAEKLLLIMEECRSDIKNHLATAITTESRKDLLFIATLLHDIAKKKTMKVENGKTVCPNHEELGAQMTVDILQRFQLSAEEKSYITAIVRNHSLPHIIFSPNNENKWQDLEALKKQFPDKWIDLCIHAMADTMGSQGEIIMPEEFKSRIDDYKSFLFQ